jgi:hypothetical protein
MADGLDVTEIVRRTVQANARFYKGWVDLSLEYFRGISEIFGGTEETTASSATPVSDRDAGAGVLVLEGEEGTAARGAFLVTNDLGRTVSCVLVASDFKDADGAKVRANVVFEPAKLDLAPGEQRVVNAVFAVDGRLAAGVGYTGEFAIKGMDGFAVPVVLRRRHGIVESPIDRAAIAAQAKRGASTGGAAKAATGKTGGRKAARKKRSRRAKQ